MFLKKKDNVIWVFYVFMVNVVVEEWWLGLFGLGKLFDLDCYFIVCVNMLGFCYGFINVCSINLVIGVFYGKDFFYFIVWDMVKVY